MPKYMFIGSYNAEGDKGVMKDGGTKRTEVARKLAASLGGSLETFYFAFGKDDFYTVAELPDNAAAAALSLTVGGAGSINIRTVVLMEPSEVDAAAQRSAEYTPPGG